VPPFQEMIDAIVAGYRAELEAPLRGVTADGQIVPGLFSTRRGIVDTAPLREAALAFLEALDPLDRPTVCFPHWMPVNAGSGSTYTRTSFATA